MSTDAATTADGFRAGRRVRQLGTGREGTIADVVHTEGHWLIQWDDKRTGYRPTADLILLPEPDAPATPEPRFKPGDPVRFTPYNDWGTRSAAIIGPGRPSLTGEATWHIRFEDGEQTSAFDGELKPMPQAEPNLPESPDSSPDSKPPHYQALRDAGHEPWAVIRSCWPAAKAVAYHQGTALVYLMRADHKHPTPDDDIRKAHAHLAEAVAILDRVSIKQN